MKRLLLTVIISVCAAASTSVATAKSTSPSHHAAQAQHNVIRGTFTQRKYLAELDQPLISSGHYVVAAQHGLIWQIRKPIKTQLVISRQHLVRSSNGHKIMELNADQQPALRIVAAVLLAVFQADMEQLREYFRIQKKAADNGHWAMTLQPASAAVAKFIDHVQVKGATHINHIELYQPGGDRTIIDLNTTAVSDTLSAAEKTEFQS